jgi:hypothetical protein
VINNGEYGGTANEGVSQNGQAWFMTWDDSNLYIAVHSANVNEASIVYVSTDASGQTGAPMGVEYDNTNITTLPFSAAVVIYARQGAIEVRFAGPAGWTNPDTTSATICTTNASSLDREEVIPWAVFHLEPSSFAWFGYVAANPTSNPNGYIYGQVPADNPGGTPANNMTYTKHFWVPDTTAAPAPFAIEQ